MGQTLTVVKKMDIRRMEVEPQKSIAKEACSQSADLGSHVICWCWSIVLYQI